MSKIWITWERDGAPTGAPADRVELAPDVADAIERYAAENRVTAAEVLASLATGLASEVGRPVDGEASAAALLELLARGGPVLVSVNPRAHGVDVPEFLRGMQGVSFRIGYGLTPPIPDLEVDADGVRATLTFSGSPHRVVLPWRAVLFAAPESGVPAPTAPKGRPKLRLV